MKKAIIIIAAISAHFQASAANKPRTSLRSADREEHGNMPTQGFLQVKDDAFWLPGLDRSPAINRLFHGSFAGLALDGPREIVDIRSRSTLPLFGLGIATFKEGRGWAFHDNTILVASEVDRLRGYVGMAASLERQVVRPPPSEKSAENDQQQGKFEENAVIEARHRLNLPWEPGTYRMTLLSRDWVSNSVHVRLVDGKAPSTARASTAQPLPGNGIALTVSGKGKTALLKAGFKVRARRELLARDTVPITFVVTGHREPMPYTKEIAASPRWVNEPGLPEHATGEIQVTFGQLAPPAPADTYYVYAFAGEELSNPVQVLVGKE